jgi:hypothetical protein
MSYLCYPTTFNGIQTKVLQSGAELIETFPVELSVYISNVVETQLVREIILGSKADITNLLTNGSLPVLEQAEQPEMCQQLYHTIKKDNLYIGFEPKMLSSLETEVLPVGSQFFGNHLVGLSMYLSSVARETGNFARLVVGELREMNQFLYRTAPDISYNLEQGSQPGGQMAYHHGVDNKDLYVAIAPRPTGSQLLCPHPG